MYGNLLIEEVDAAFLSAGVYKRTTLEENPDRVLLEFSLLLLERIKSLEEKLNEAVQRI